MFKLLNVSLICLTLSWQGPYYIETSTLICRANQLTDCYMKGTSLVKELLNNMLKFLNITLSCPVFLECGNSASQKQPPWCSIEKSAFRFSLVQSRFNAY